MVLPLVLPAAGRRVLTQGGRTAIYKIPISRVQIFAGNKRFSTKKPQRFTPPRLPATSGGLELLCRGLITYGEMIIYVC